MILICGAISFMAVLVIGTCLLLMPIILSVEYLNRKRPLCFQCAGQTGDRARTYEMINSPDFKEYQCVRCGKWHNVLYLPR